jgi:hypothetical protein
LVDVTVNGDILEDLANLAGAVDHVRRTVRGARVAQDAERRCELLVRIGKKREAGCAGDRVRLLLLDRIYADADYLGV